MTIAAGIDVGGTKIAGGLVDDRGRILEHVRVPTPTADADHIFETLADTIEALRRHTPVAHLGVAVPGFVDESGSVVRRTPNLPWRNEPLRARLEARFPDVAITVENDANAAGWAESRFGAARGRRHMTLLTIGTGVGGAIVADGRLLRGGFGGAAELGHIRVVADGLRCGCGAYGCLEQYGSGSALLRVANDLADAEPGSSSLARARRENGTLDGAVLHRLIVAGDPEANLALANIGTQIGRAAATICSVLDSEIVVIGGGVAETGDRLLGPVREAFTRALPARAERPAPEIVIAEMVNAAGIVGVADLARLSSRPPHLSERRPSQPADLQDGVERVRDSS